MRVPTVAARSQTCNSLGVARGLHKQNGCQVAVGWSSVDGSQSRLTVTSMLTQKAFVNRSVATDCSATDIAIASDLGFVAAASAGTVLVVNVLDPGAPVVAAAATAPLGAVDVLAVNSW